MTQITKSLGTDIEVLSANGLSTFIDVNDGVPKWKDTNGFIEPMSNYIDTTIENIGTGAEVYVDGSTTPSQMRTITQGANVVITQNTNDIQISVPATIVGQVGLYSQTAKSTPVTNTTIATSLIDGGVGSLSVPANGFQVGDSFVAKFMGEISSLNNAQLEIRISSNGVVLADSGVFSLVVTNNKIWDMEIDFTIRTIGGAGVASIATAGRFNYNKNSNNTPESVGFFFANNTTFDTTIANTLQVTAQWGSASTSNIIATELFTLYRVY
jgi:hypothetical protein